MEGMKGVGVVGRTVSIWEGDNGWTVGQLRGAIGHRAIAGKRRSERKVRGNYVTNIGRA